MKRFFFISIAQILFLLLFAGASFAVDVTIFGPQQYERHKGKPTVLTDSFWALPKEAQLIIENGEWNGNQRVNSTMSSAIILMNGIEVFGPSDFNKNVHFLDKKILLTEDNTLSVELNSSPNSYLTIKVVQDIPPPTVSISANPTGVHFEEKSNLSWETTIADNCVIEPGIGAVPCNGSVPVSPSETTTYALTATGLGGTTTVTTTVTYINTEPVANPQSVSTNEDTSTPIVLAGSDIDGDPLTYKVLLSPANGVLSGIAPNLSYTPDLNFNGSDLFTFSVNDETVDSQTATVNINVIAVNDVPEADTLTLITDEDVLGPIILSGTDVDGDALSYNVIVGPANGILTGTAPDLTYSPNPDFNGSDVLTFTVNDGEVDSAPASVVITINPVNDTPVASAGPDQTVFRGNQVNLDGSGSNDIDSDSLLYHWSFSARPVGSSTVLVGPETVNPSFVADIVGEYVLQLIVNDAKVASPNDAVVITANPVLVTIPYVEGIPQAEAKAAILNAGLILGNTTDAYSDTVPGGNVISQNPATGAVVEENTSVTLVISIGPENFVMSPPADVDLGLGFPEQQGGGGLVADTVRILTGNVIEARSDLNFPSPNSFGLSLAAFYNSQSDQVGAMGHGWSHTYEVTLDTNYYIGNHAVYRIIDQTGRASYFRRDATNQRYNGLFHEKSHIVDEEGAHVWQRTDGSRFGFNQDGSLAWMDDEKGNRLELSYSAGQLTTVTDNATGRALTFIYNGTLLDSVQGSTTTAVSTGEWVSFQYDTFNNLTQVNYGDLSGHKYSYTDATDIHNLTAHKNMLDHLQSNWAYDSFDRCTANYSVNGKGAENIAYNASGALVDVTDAYNVVRTYSISDPTVYEGRKRVVAMAGIAGAPYGGDVKNWGYDDDLNLTQVTTVGGTINKYQNFDANGNPQTVILAAGAIDIEGNPITRTVNYTFHPVLNTLMSRSEESILGNSSDEQKETVYDYDDDGNTIPNENPTTLLHRVIEKGYTINIGNIITPYEYITTYTYQDTLAESCNGIGLVAAIDGPLAGSDDTTTLTYDQTDCNLLSVTNPTVNGVALSTSFDLYDNVGHPTRITDTNKQTSTIVYDGRGRVTNVTHLADNSSASTVYNLAGQPVARTDEDGVVTTYTYDSAFGRLERIYDADNNYIQYTYDYQGNVIAIEKLDALGNRSFVKSFAYDDPNAVIPGKLYSQTSGYTTTYGYDVAGNLATITDPDSNVTSRYYDGYNRLVQTSRVSAAGLDMGANWFTYDQHGNLDIVIAELDVAQAVDTDYDYDDMGRRLSGQSLDTNMTSYVYDAANNMTDKIDAMGVIVSYGYDLLGRPTDITFPGDALNNTTDLYFAYDSSINGLGRLAALTEKNNGGNITGIIAYGYDGRGRLVDMASTYNGQTFTMERTYTPTGKIKNITYPSGRVMDFSLNALGQVTDVDTTVGASTIALADNLTYNPFGSARGVATSNGSEINNETGECGCGVTVANAGTVNEQIYTYDGNRNLAAVTMPQQPWMDETYSYNANNHLTTADGPFGSFAYTNDFQGNRLSSSKNGQSNTYSYVANSNILETIAGNQPASYTYDLNGNASGVGTRVFTYDLQNRLLQVDNGATTLGTYEYNGLNQRVAKTASGVTTLFVYDFEGNIVAEAQADGTINSEMLYWGTTRLARVDISGSTETLYYYLNDRLGTPKAITNEANQSVWEAIYSPFGDAQVNPNSSIVNNFRFPGQYYDEETGLHYNWHRYYDPSTGRYLTPDPIGLAGGLNLYLYAGGNPVNYVDPMGLRSCNFWRDVWENFRDTNEFIGLGRSALTVGFGSSFARTYGGYTIGQYAIRGVAPHLGRHMATAGLVARTTILNGILITGSFEAGVAVGSVLNVGADWLLNDPIDPCECQ